VLNGIYSFLMASVMIALDAVDVAMTEASVGAGVSTVLFLGALSLTKSREMRPAHSNLVALVLAGAVGLMVVWGTLSLPPFGAFEAPIHRHVAPTYLESSIPETGVPNVVTAVLADFRSFDTLGEVTVIFTAGIGVMLLLRGRHRRREKPEGDRA
jgi:multicomponent Na+:H+ antiporter subunit B